MKLALQFLAVAWLLAMTGCGGKDKAADKPAAQGAKAKTSAGATNAPGASTNVLVAAVNPSISEFSTNEAKDPFYPRSQPKPTTGGPGGTSRPPEPPAGEVVKAALQRVFGGIFGGAQERYAVLNGLPLGLGQSMAVNVAIQGQPKRYNVKLVRISRSVAELQVEGIPQPIPLTVTAR